MEMLTDEFAAAYTIYLRNTCNAENLALHPRIGDAAMRFILMSDVIKNWKINIDRDIL